MRIITRGIHIVLGLVVSGLLISEAQAVPAFARQTGMACSSCHFQNFPSLNSFGRVFKAQGYTMRGAAPLVEGDKLSIPADLKATVITKVRYELGENVKGGRGQIQWPDEAAIIVGGRAAENAGYLMELGLTPQDVSVVENKTTGTFLSAKFQFNVTNEFAITPFSTDAAGPAYGFELLNTGVQRNQRVIERRQSMSAYSAAGIESSATGFAFVYHTPTYYINYTHWAPTWGTVETGGNDYANILGGLGHYFRAVYTPNLGGWDTGFGVTYLSGDIKTGATDPANKVHLKGWGIDAQAQGAAGDMPVGLYASYAVAPKSDNATDKQNIYNSSLTDDTKAYALLGTIGVLPGTAELYAAYSSTDTGAATKKNEATVGVMLNPAQNIRFEVFTVQSNQTGADYTMAMMFAAF